jgi:hypothetical protein
LMIDANQRWDVSEAIERVRALADLNLLWIEEPTSPDDVLGHAAIRQGVRPVGVATGEHAQNRIIFKQLLQAEAIDFCQIDSCRLGGVNENLAVILMAAKFGVPVCPHAGGVGLCELVQHLSMFDFLRVSGRMDDRVTEFVDHLHEHFVDPVCHPFFFLFQCALHAVRVRPGIQAPRNQKGSQEEESIDTRHGPLWFTCVNRTSFFLFCLRRNQELWYLKSKPAALAASSPYIIVRTWYWSPPRTPGLL